MNKELEELMLVAQVNGMRKNKIRETFALLEDTKKKQFVEDFRFEIIRTTTKLTYHA